MVRIIVNITLTIAASQIFPLGLQLVDFYTGGKLHWAYWLAIAIGGLFGWEVLAKCAGEKSTWRWFSTSYRDKFAFAVGMIVSYTIFGIPLKLELNFGGIYLPWIVMAIPVAYGAILLLGSTKLRKVLLHPTVSIDPANPKVIDN